MRIGSLKRGVVSILLVVALLSSIISVAPLATPGDLLYPPPPYETTIEVVQGDNFLIRHVLAFNQPEDGAYTVTIGWTNYDNKPEENFTFLMAEAYYTADNSYQQADITMAWAPSGSDTSYALSVKRPADNKDPRNGQFNVDIWMGAYGAGGVPHIPTDNHLIQGGVIITESGMDFWESFIIIKVLPRQPGVKVDISPTSQEGVPGATLTYSVTVSNTGDIYDNYDLAASDSENWGPTLSENLLENVGPGENRVITLSVTIPENATSFDEDNITVTATSVENALVGNSASCLALVEGKVKFCLATLYEVNLDTDLHLGGGSKLVVKFYRYTNVYLGENVVWSGATPDNVSLSKIVPHPQGWVGVENVRLDLTYDSTENVILTLDNFTVRKGDLENRFTIIPMGWALALPPDKIRYEIEFMDLPLYWALAPPGGPSDP